RSASPEAVRRFYHDWYRPDLMAVFVVGDVEPGEAEQMIKAHFSGLRNPAPARLREYAAIPERQDTEALVVTDKEATSNSVLIRYPVRPAPERATYGAWRERLVESLFTTMLAQRLQELAQLPDAPFLGAASGLSRLTPRYKSYNASATIGPRGAAPAIAALLQENQRARQHGFGSAELERTAKAMLRRYERGFNERDKTDSSAYVAEYTRNFLSGEPVPGIEAEYRLVQELLAGITLDEVNAAARRTIPVDAGKLVLYTGIDRADPAPPTGPQLLAAVAAAEGAQVGTRLEKTLATRLMEHPPAPGGIVAESSDKTLGLTRLTLSNGVKVILKPTDFRNDQVLMGAVRYGGQTLFGEKDIANARYASTLVGAMGLQDFTPLDLSKVLAGRVAAVGLSLGSYTDTVAGSAGAAPEDIETMLQMLWLRFAGVRRDEDLYKSYMGKQAEVVRNLHSQPGARFNEAIVSTLYNNHPYAPHAVRPQDLAQVSLERSIDIYRQRFSSAKGLTFILVGSFDVAAIKPLLATYLATLPTPDIPIAYRDVGMRPVTGVVKREVKGGADPKSTVSLTFTGPAEYSHEELLRLSALVEVMNIRIVDVLREKLGLIYGGGMGRALNRIPYPHYSVAATLPTGPEKVDKVIAATFAEIERIKAEGPDPADLDKVKRNWRQNYRRALRENGYWLQRLQASELDGTDPARILASETEADALTVDEVKAAAKRYFNTDNYVQVVLNPTSQESKVATSAAGSN
ncbi:MAG: M16 family metallopeptidase, partial [Massilia sp.]